MAAILVLLCLIANWPFWPRSSLNILLNFTFESEAKRANWQGNKNLLKWRPFWNKVYLTDVSMAVFILDTERSSAKNGSSSDNSPVYKYG